MQSPLILYLHILFVVGIPQAVASSVPTTSNGSAVGVCQLHSSSSSVPITPTVAPSVAATPPPTPASPAAPQTSVPLTPTPTTTAVTTTTSQTSSQSPPSSGPIRQKSWELLDPQAIAAAKKATSQPQNPSTTSVVVCILFKHYQDQSLKCCFLWQIHHLKFIVSIQNIKIENLLKDCITLKHCYMKLLWLSLFEKVNLNTCFCVSTCVSIYQD